MDLDVTHSVTPRQAVSVTKAVIGSGPPARYVTEMVTAIHDKGGKRRLFLRENRKAKGVSAPTMAGRMGMERESLLRLEREWRRCGPEKQARYAAALGLAPEDLWRLPTPERPSNGIQAQLDELRQQVEQLRGGKARKSGT